MGSRKTALGTPGCLQTLVMLWLRDTRKRQTHAGRSEPSTHRAHRVPHGRAPSAKETTVDFSLKVTGHAHAGQRSVYDGHV